MKHGLRIKSEAGRRKFEIRVEPEGIDRIYRIEDLSPHPIP
jgi:hypothetical protein